MFTKNIFLQNESCIIVIWTNFSTNKTMLDFFPAQPIRDFYLLPFLSHNHIFFSCISILTWFQRLIILFNINVLLNNCIKICLLDIFFPFCCVLVSFYSEFVTSESSILGNAEHSEKGHVNCVPINIFLIQLTAHLNLSCNHECPLNQDIVVV